MSANKKIIDNNRVHLAEVLRRIAPAFKELSIATGYWDLPGTAEILEQIKDYDSIRLLIGQEPLSPRNAKLLKLDAPDPIYPNADFAYDLANIENDDLRQTLLKVKELVHTGKLEVRIYKRSFLHAKAYIFGDFLSKDAIGVIGSSNFTKAGLTTNTELNALEDDYKIVKYQPQAPTDEHGHLSWFNSIWNDELTVPWNGEFTNILSDSPLGDLSFGAYDVYIKTLMEVYPDELVPVQQLDKSAEEVLFTFQYRNAQILINKLERMGMAMLSDSVGLGKTITSGAVINHYKKNGATRIYVIAPASLKSQWTKDLAQHFKLVQGFEVISLQDAAAIAKAQELDQYKSVDLFVVDEAHNLRNAGGRRHQQLLEWFINNPESKVLMLTATPINNSLTDFVNQIQLATKGALESINVDYRDENDRLYKTDFFDALKMIQSRIRKAENAGQQFDWSAIAPVVASGLRHYLVRTTRQGIKQMGGIVLADGTKMDFPESKVEQIGYHFSDTTKEIVKQAISSDLSAFEGIDPRTLDLEDLLDQTQRSEHPLDVISKGQFKTSDSNLENVFANIFQMILLIGFAPYRADIYQHKIHKKTIQEIRDLGLKPKESAKILSQLSIHNMLRVTWLKRLESSQAALQQSIQNYIVKLDKFELFLNQGKIMSFKDIDNAIAEFGEDVEEFVDQLEDFENADTSKFNIEALKKDLQRDRAIAKKIGHILQSLAGHDDKLIRFAEFVNDHAKSTDPAKKKLVVFSYFADTIRYLESALPTLVNEVDLNEVAAFVSGGQAGIEDLTGRFAPKAKKYELKAGEKELNYLFATDVLSEGQNLQDAGSLVNYDLHWNPVRMIQRNGRINRLGSEFETVYVSNMKPEDKLETYLLLLNRLNRKIDTIKNTIGLDQDVLNAGEINAIEFIDGHANKGDSPVEDQLLNLYGEHAAHVIEQIEAQENQFYVDDDFIYDLRSFLAAHVNTPEVIERIKSIPIGKWSLIPQSKNFDAEDKVMGLAKLRGETSVTSTTIDDSYFVTVDTSDSNHKADSIEDSKALAILRTTPDDNERRKDQLTLNRSLVAKRVKAAAKARGNKASQSYSPKPSEQAILGIFETLLPGRGFLALVSQKITNKKELTDFRRIIAAAKSDLQEHGQILAPTIQKMDVYSQELKDKVVEKVKIEEVIGVLFYAK